MRKFNVKKISDVELATLFYRIDKVFQKHEDIAMSKFQNIYEIFKMEINRRNYGLIYKAACKFVKNHGLNQFDAARIYADSALSDSNYFETNTSWEISSFDCKAGHPVVVDLISAWVR